MAEITGLGQQKNKDKLNLFIDGEYFGSMLKETAIINNFFVGKIVDKKEVEEILLQSQAKQAFLKASDYLATRMHTRRELYTKLLAKGYNKAAINSALDKLQEYGYISDEQFAEQFVNQNNRLSRKQASIKLAQKGVNKEISASATAAITDEDELNNAISLAQKYLRGKIPQQSTQKLYAFLQRKGFESSTISAAIKAVTNVDIEDI